MNAFKKLLSLLLCLVMCLSLFPVSALADEDLVADQEDVSEQALEEAQPLSVPDEEFPAGETETTFPDGNPDGGVTVAEPEPELEEPVPVEEPVLVEDSVPLEEPAPVEEPVPAEEPAPVEESAQVEEPVPIVESAPAKEPALIEDFAPVEESGEELAVPVEEPVAQDSVAEEQAALPEEAAPEEAVVEEPEEDEEKAEDSQSDTRTELSAEEALSSATAAALVVTPSDWEWEEHHVVLGETVTLTVTAEAEGGLSIASYQWFSVDPLDELSDWVPITGAVQAYYTIESVSATLNYRCEVKDSNENTSNACFAVHVENNLQIRSGLEDERQHAFVSPGDVTTLEVTATATDTSALKYQWYYYPENAGPESSSKLGSGTSQQTKAADGNYTYCCEVFDQYGNQSTIEFYVQVENSLRVDSALAGGETWVTVKYKETAILKVNATAVDTTGLKYSWYVETNSGQHTELGKKAKQTTDPIVESCIYTCEVTDQYGSYASCSFTVSVENNLNIEIPDSYGLTYTDVFVKYGKAATLTAKVSAGNLAGATYTWYEVKSGHPSKLKSGTLKKGTAKTLTWELAAVKKACHYRLVVVDRYGNQVGADYSVQVDNDLRLKYASSENWDVPVSYGKTKTLKAVVTGKNLKGATYVWSSQGGEVASGKVDTDKKTVSLKTAKVKEPCSYLLTVTDRYGNRAMLEYRVHVENHLQAVSVSQGTTNNTVQVPYGKSASLKIRITADTLEGAVYTVYDGSGSPPTEKALSATTAKTLTLKTPAVKESGSYQIMVGDKFGNEQWCSFQLVVNNHLRVATAGGTPSATVTVSPNKRTTLRVLATADDTSGLSYQWRRNGRIIAGADQATYKVPAMKTFDRFSCDVIDRFGNRSSASYEVVVQNHLKASFKNKVDKENLLTVPYGSTATLAVKVSADDTSGLRCIWLEETSYYDGLSPVSNKKSFTTPKISEARTYYCNVSDKYNNHIQLSVTVVPDNNVQVKASGKTVRAVEKGSKVKLGVSVSANDTTKMSYQWYILPDNGYGYSGYYAYGEIPGATKRTYSPTVNQNAQYVCRVTDRYGGEYFCYYTVVTKDFTASKVGTPVLKSSGGKVTLTWKALDGAQDYVIQRKGPDGSWTTLNKDDHTNVATYTDSSVKVGTKYSYRVVAYFCGAHTKASSAKSITVKK